MSQKTVIVSEISDSHSSKYEDDSFLGYNALQYLFHHPDDGDRMHL
jgi:hypothetical protein